MLETDVNFSLYTGYQPELKSSRARLRSTIVDGASAFDPPVCIKTYLMVDQFNVGGSLKEFQYDEARRYDPSDFGPTDFP